MNPWEWLANVTKAKPRKKAAAPKKKPERPHAKPMHRKSKSFELGDKVGQLTLREYLPGTVSNGVRMWGKWRCACICGATVDVRTNNLRSGNTKSCGCMSRSKTTGYGRTPEYGHINGGLGPKENL